MKNFEIVPVKKFSIDGVEVQTDIEKLTFNDAEETLKYLNEISEFPVAALNITWNSKGYLDCYYELQPPKFERIRRITGYLTGDLTSWNDAKRHEESERVKHA